MWSVDRAQQLAIRAARSSSGSLLEQARERSAQNLNLLELVSLARVRLEYWISFWRMAHGHVARQLAAGVPEIDLECEGVLPRPVSTTHCSGVFEIRPPSQ